LTTVLTALLLFASQDSTKAKGGGQGRYFLVHIPDEEAQPVPPVNAVEVGQDYGEDTKDTKGIKEKGKKKKKQKEKKPKEKKKVHGKSKQKKKGFDLDASKKLNRQYLQQGCGFFGTIGCNRAPIYGPFREATPGNAGTKPQLVKGVQDGHELIRNIVHGLASPHFNRPGGVNYVPGVEPFRKEKNTNIQGDIYNSRNTFTGSGNYETRDKDGRIILQRGKPYPGQVGGTARG